MKSLWRTKEKLPREHTYSLEDLHYMYSLGTLTVNMAIFSHNFGYLLARVVNNYKFLIHLDSYSLRSSRYERKLCLVRWNECMFVQLKLSFVWIGTPLRKTLPSSE